MRWRGRPLVVWNSGGRLGKGSTRSSISWIEEENLGVILGLMEVRLTGVEQR